MVCFRRRVRRHESCWGDVLNEQEGEEHGNIWHGSTLLLQERDDRGRGEGSLGLSLKGSLLLTTTLMSMDIKHWNDGT